MTNGADMSVGGALSVPAFFGWAVQLFKNPRGFFRGMEKTGGYLTPSLYLLGWGVISAAVGFLVALTRPVPLGFAGGRAAQGLNILFNPLGALALAFGLVVVYLFVIWHWMGSKENYQTAFRVWAFLAPLGLVSAVLGLVPYLPLLILPYAVYLIVIASEEVHGIPAQRAWTVWGILGGTLLLFALVAAVAGKSLQGGRGGFSSPSAAEPRFTR